MMCAVRRNWLKFLLAVWVVLFQVILSPVTLPSAEVPVSASFRAAFQIDAYRIDCTVAEDGSLVLQETVDLQFTDDSEAVQFNLQRGEATALTLQAVAISEVTASGEAASQIEVLPASSSGQAGTRTLSYTLSETGAATKVTISSLNAAGSSQRFLVTYRLDGAFERAADAVSLRLKLFQSLGSRPIAKPVLMLHYPAGLAITDLWYRPISPADFLAVPLEAGTVQMSATKLAADEPLEAYLLLPADVLPAQFAARPGPHKDRSFLIQAVEQEIRQLNRSAQLVRVLNSAIWLLLLAAALVYFLLQLLLEREGRFQLRQTIPPQVRAAYRPAMLARLIRIHRPGELLLSTLLDLVNRGHLGLDGHVFRCDNQQAPDYRGMAAYEIFLLNWLFQRVTQENTLSTAQIRKYALDPQRASEFSAYYQQFMILIQDELVKTGLHDPRKGRISRLIGFSTSAVYGLLAGFIGWMTWNPLALLLLFPTTLFALYGLKVRHLTGAGYDQADIARVYRKGLIHYRTVCPPDLQTASHLAAQLPCAVALGVGRTYLDQVSQLGNQKPDELASLVGHFTRSSLAADPVLQIQQFGRDLDVMNSMLSASLYLALGFHFYE